MISYLRTAPQRKLSGRALLRLDFNTEDEWRMEATLPTVRYLARVSRAVVILSHRGRPKGFARTLSLARDARNLSKLLRRPVHFIRHFRFNEIRVVIEKSPRGSIFLLENLRFLPGEEKNDTRLASQLASLGDFYVNDAFAVSHRADASVARLARKLPAYAGFEFEREIVHLSHVMTKSKKPVVLVLGGAKAHTKLPVISYFKKRASHIIVGGGVSNTILKLEGFSIGNSIYDKAMKPAFLRRIDRRKLVLPVDYTEHHKVLLDIGPRSVRLFSKILEGAGTVIWNGPFGMIEKNAYKKGTLGIARAIAKNRRAFTVVGGGETVMFLKKYGLDKKISFISTGGGAMLEFLAGKKLPGIEAFKK